MIFEKSCSLTLKRRFKKKALKVLDTIDMQIKIFLLLIQSHQFHPHLIIFIYLPKYTREKSLLNFSVLIIQESWIQTIPEQCCIQFKSLARYNLYFRRALLANSI